MTFRTCMWTWNEADESMRLKPAFRRVAKAQFVDGEDYAMDVRERRSSREHNHYFAAVNEAWIHLNDESREKLNSPEKLRKWALIHVGRCDQSVFGPMPHRTALKWAQTAAVFFRRGEDYVEISVRPVYGDLGKRTGESLVIMKAAVSQSRASMDRETFRQSKREVLDLLAGKIEVKRSELEKAGVMAAE